MDPKSAHHRNSCIFMFIMALSTEPSYGISLGIAQLRMDKENINTSRVWANLST